MYRCVEQNESLAIGFSFGLFQGFLFLLGYVSGYGLAGYLISMKYTLSMLIMLFIGMKMIVGVRRVDPELRVLAKKDNRGLMILSLALGINAFITGIALGLIAVSPWHMAGLLFISTYLLVLTGIRLGKYGKFRFGQQSEIAAGIVFLGVAVVMLLRHLKIM